MVGLERPLHSFSHWSSDWVSSCARYGVRIQILGLVFSNSVTLTDLDKPGAIVSQTAPACAVLQALCAGVSTLHAVPFPKSLLEATFANEDGSLKESRKVLLHGKWEIFLLSLLTPEQVFRTILFYNIIREALVKGEPFP